MDMKEMSEVKRHVNEAVHDGVAKIHGEVRKHAKQAILAIIAVGILAVIAGALLHSH